MPITATLLSLLAFVALLLLGGLTGLYLPAAVALFVIPFVAFLDMLAGVGGLLGGLASLMRKPE